MPEAMRPIEPVHSSNGMNTNGAMLGSTLTFV